MFENGKYSPMKASGDWGLSILIGLAITGVFWLAWKIIKGIFIVLLHVFAYIIGDSPKDSNKTK